MKDIKNIVFYKNMVISSDSDITLVHADTEEEAQQICEKKYNLMQANSELTSIDGIKNQNRIQELVATIVKSAALVLAFGVVVGTVGTQPLLVILTNVLLLFGAAEAFTLLTCGTRKKRQKAQEDIEFRELELEEEISKLNIEINELQKNSTYVEFISDDKEASDHSFERRSIITTNEKTRTHKLVKANGKF